ncbi:DinI family protein [Vibrio parahaemolyticus]|uniref:DinI-like family protein n=1 Tax=Vibrio parahaemolyticus TaxID=670 RepID=UPI001120E503|nr:DinI-like family protein [Vibrio parahaemolyticus]TOK17507.1 DinI family protein [Vibrio parahaemolyticus]
MRVEMMVQKDKLPKNGVSLITVELEKRLWVVFPDAKVRVRSGTSNQLDIYAHKDKKLLANKIIEQAFNV